MAQYLGLKYISSFLFGCNYAGVIYGAFTFLNEPEPKKSLFLSTVLKHSLFMCNNYFIYLWKFDLKTLRLLNLTNDLGAFLTCFPNYFMLMFPAAQARLPFTHKKELDLNQLLYAEQNKEQNAKQTVESVQPEVQPIDKEKRIAELLSQRNLDEVLDEISSQSARTKQEQKVFDSMYQWYKVDNRQVSQAVELSGYGLLLASLGYVAKLRYRR